MAWERYKTEGGPLGLAFGLEGGGQGKSPTIDKLAQMLDERAIARWIGSQLEKARAAHKTIRIEDADPPDSHAFGPSGEPKVLYRADGRVDRSLGHRVAAKLMAALTLRIAQNAEILWSFQDAFELQTCVLLTPLAGVGCQGVFVCVQKCFMDGSADAVVTDHNEPRRLHETDRRSTMSRGQQALNQLVRQRHFKKAPAYIAPGGNNAIDSIALLHLKLCAFLHHHALDHLGPVFVSSRRRASTPALNSMSRPKSQIASESRLR